MTRRDYMRCEFLDDDGETCNHRDRKTWWADLPGTCPTCELCPLDCMPLPGRPDECPYGRMKARGVNTLPAAEGGAK